MSSAGISANDKQIDKPIAAPTNGSLQVKPADDDPNSFYYKIAHNDGLAILGVVSNFAGVLGIVSTATGVISFLQGLGQPDNSAILSAIQQLQANLESDFLHLGDLINQQAQLTQETVNRDTMAAALASSDTATNLIQAFLSAGGNQTLQFAETYSSLGFRFFIELNLSSAADLSFFLPGFIKAASVRLFVIASEPLNVREPQSVLVADISAMVNLLTAMINSIKSTINAAHVVTTKSHIVQCTVFPQIREAAAPSFGQPHRNVTVIDGYYHDERVVATDGSGDVSLVTLAFFDAQQGTPPCEQPSDFQAGALAAAQTARNQGVTDELAFLSVPYFEQILQAWTIFLTAVSTPPITTVLNLNGTWKTGGTPGLVITVNGNSISIDLSLYNRPSAYGSIIDSSDITVTFPDDKTYTAVLQPPGTIQWSNNTTWTKV